MAKVQYVSATQGPTPASNNRFVRGFRNDQNFLTCVDHSALSYDKDYVSSDFASRLRDRPCVSDDLIDAFADLFSVINDCPPPDMHEELAETGLVRMDLVFVGWRDAPDLFVR